jgi:hypothetical protein
MQICTWYLVVLTVVCMLIFYYIYVLICTLASGVKSGCMYVNMYIGI